MNYKIKIWCRKYHQGCKNNHSLTENELIEFKNVIEKLNNLQIQELRKKAKWSSEKVDKLIDEVNNKHKDLINHIYHIIN